MLGTQQVPLEESARFRVLSSTLKRQDVSQVGGRVQILFDGFPSCNPWKFEKTIQNDRELHQVDDVLREFSTP